MICFCLFEGVMSLRFNEVQQMGEDMTEDDEGRRRRRRRRRRKTDSTPGLTRTKAPTPAPPTRSSVTVEFFGSPVIPADPNPPGTIDKLVANAAFKTAVIGIVSPVMATRLQTLRELSETRNTAASVNAALVVGLSVSAVKLPNSVVPLRSLMNKRVMFRIQLSWPDDGGWVKSSEGPPTSAQLAALWSAQGFTAALQAAFDVGTAAVPVGILRQYGALGMLTPGITPGSIANTWMEASLSIQVTLTTSSLAPIGSAITRPDFAEENQNLFGRGADFGTGDQHYVYASALKKGLLTMYRLDDVKGAQVTIERLNGHMLAPYFTTLIFEFTLTMQSAAAAGVLARTVDEVESYFRAFEAMNVFRARFKSTVASVLKIPLTSLSGNDDNRPAQLQGSTDRSADGNIACTILAAGIGTVPRTCQYRISYVGPGGDTGGSNGVVGEMRTFIDLNADLDQDGNNDVDELMSQIVRTVGLNGIGGVTYTDDGGNPITTLGPASIDSAVDAVRNGDDAYDCTVTAGDCTDGGGQASVAYATVGVAWYHVRYRISLQKDSFPVPAIKIRDWATATTAYTSFATSVLSAMRSTPEFAEMGLIPASAEANGLMTHADIESLR